MADKLAPHPGEIVKAEFDRLHLSTSRGAKVLGVSNATMFRLVAGTHSLSPEMALRLEAVIGRTAEDWLHMQADYDAGQARMTKGSAVSGLARYKPKPIAPNHGQVGLL